MEGHRTATYCAVLQKGGQLLFGIGDMDIHSQITPEYVSIMQVWQTSFEQVAPVTLVMHLCLFSTLRHSVECKIKIILQIEKFQSVIEGAKMLCIDGNITPDAMRSALQIAQSKKVPGKCF